jgi:hypothetical protein
MPVRTIDEIQSMEDLMELAMEDERAAEFAHAIEYAADGAKTEQLHFVSSLNCDLESARDDMVLTKKQYGKTGGIQAFHGIQSFKPFEATPDMAHEIGIKLAQELWGDRFEVVIATHVNKNHLHNHFVLNSVSFADGMKFYDNLETYAKMRKASDRLCAEYGLDVIKNPKRDKSKHYAEWNAEKEGRATWRSLIKADIDEAIAQSMTENHFVMNMQKRGYQVRLGKHISIIPPGRGKALRLETKFGEAYSRQGIISQMRGRRPTLPEPTSKRASKKMPFRGNIKQAKKLTGFRALYVHYLYLLGKIPKSRPKPLTKVNYIYRQDLLKIDKISNEIKLLSRNQIDTKEQLFSFKAELSERMELYTAARADLRNQLRREKSEPEKAEIKNKISILSKGLGEARKEVKLCDDIAERTEAIKMKCQRGSQERNDKNISRKEKAGYEPFR